MVIRNLLIECAGLKSPLSTSTANYYPFLAPTLGVLIHIKNEEHKVGSNKTHTNHFSTPLCKQRRKDQLHLNH